jgi:uncharacterized protein
MRSAAPTTRAELLAWAQRDEILSSILNEARKAEHGDAAHDLSHLVRVALFTIRFAEDAVDPRECVAAALLHDHVNLPKNHPERAKASELSAEAAGPILARAGFGEDAILRIKDAIRDHSFSRGAVPSGILGRALQDADRLEALGAIGLMRVFSTGARMGTSYFHADDPWAKDRALDDSRYSIDHFFTKLLKLPATFLTPGGRAEAEKRGRRLEAFLDDAADEIGEPRP